MLWQTPANQRARKGFPRGSCLSWALRDEEEETWQGELSRKRRFLAKPPLGGDVAHSRNWKGAAGSDGGLVGLGMSGWPGIRFLFEKITGLSWRVLKERRLEAVAVIQMTGIFACLHYYNKTLDIGYFLLCIKPRAIQSWDSGWGHLNPNYLPESSLCTGIWLTFHPVNISQGDEIAVHGPLESTFKPSQRVVRTWAEMGRGRHWLCNIADWVVLAAFQLLWQLYPRTLTHGEERFVSIPDVRGSSLCSISPVALDL